MQIPLQKDKVAIVVVGYNRLSSTQRLVASLINAKYPDKDVPLVFSIDASGNQELYDWVNNVEWPHGPKYVIIHKDRLGLRKHIYFCGDLTEYFKAVIILEDDILVSPDFYLYSKKSVDFYYDDDRVAGIALFADQTNGYAHGLPNFRYNDGSEAYMLQEVCTSGECFTDKMWNGFRQWKAENENADPYSFYMPEAIKTWRQAWSKYYNMYILDKGGYFLTPYLSRTTNCGDAGVHSEVNLNFLHAYMLWGVRNDYDFKPFKDSVKYDMFGDFIGLGQYLGIADDSLCVDFYGNKPYKETHRYILSLHKLPYKVLNSYGLILEPIEANVMHQVQGSDIYLYDTHTKTSGKTVRRLTLSHLSYFMRGTSYWVQLRFSFLMILSRVQSKIRRLLKK